MIATELLAQLLALLAAAQPPLEVPRAHLTGQLRAAIDGLGCGRTTGRAIPLNEDTIAITEPLVAGGAVLGKRCQIMVLSNTPGYRYAVAGVRMVGLAEMPPGLGGVVKLVRHFTGSAAVRVDSLKLSPGLSGVVSLDAPTPPDELIFSSCGGARNLNLELSVAPSGPSLVPYRVSITWLELSFVWESCVE
jgi:hypothetical protein